MWTDNALLLDTETTGTDTETDRIVTATVIRMVDSRVVTTDQWIADPGIEIPTEASDIHGVTTERARAEGQPAPAVIAEIDVALGEYWSPDCPVIAYNASFDLSILDAELRRYQNRPLCIAGPVIDPFVMDKALDKWRKGSRKLSDVCEHYGVTIGQAHDATEDALAAARVAWKIARRWEWLQKVALPGLHDKQVKWYEQQQAGFAEYLTSKVAVQLRAVAETLDGDDRAAKLAEADEVVARAKLILADTAWPVRSVAA